MPVVGCRAEVYDSHMPSRWLLAAMSATAACYEPRIPAGAPCGPNETCPSGLECIAGICGGSDPIVDGAQGGDDGSNVPVSGPWGPPMRFMTLGGGIDETDP